MTVLDVVNDGGRAPDLASFTADGDGRAVFIGRVEGDLLTAGQVFFRIVYHFDSMTYYPFPRMPFHSSTSRSSRRWWRRSASAACRAMASSAP